MVGEKLEGSSDICGPPLSKSTGVSIARLVLQPQPHSAYFQGRGEQKRCRGRLGTEKSPDDLDHVMNTQRTNFNYYIPSQFAD